MADATSRTASPRVPCTVHGLELVVEEVTTGPSAPAIALRVYSRGRATNVGCSVAAQYAQELAAIILTSAKQAAGVR